MTAHCIEDDHLHDDVHWSEIEATNLIAIVWQGGEERWCWEKLRGEVQYLLMRAHARGAEWSNKNINIVYGAPGTDEEEVEGGW